MCYTGRCRWEVSSGDSVGECLHPHSRKWAYLAAKGIWEADDPFGTFYIGCEVPDGPEEEEVSFPINLDTITEKTGKY